MKVMVVEDHAPMRTLIRNALRLPDADVIECASGSEAVARYAETHPDWVTMDCRMEPIDGITATVRLRACDPRARIVIVTSWDDPALRLAARAAGAEEYLLKDHLHRLAEIVRRPPPPAPPPNP